MTDLHSPSPSPQPPVNANSPVAAIPPMQPFRGRLIVQIIGFLLSMALLAWCIRSALSPRNEESLKKLAHAPLGDVAFLLGLSVATLLLNGAKFWVVIRPVHKLKFWDVESVNALAAFASYVPFKMSLFLRFLIHNRRDKVPFLTIGAWMGAVGIILLGALAPLIGVSIWRKKVDTPFVVVGLLGLVVMYVATFAVAKLFSQERGLDRIRAIGRFLHFGFIQTLLHSDAFAKAHAGFDMLAHPVALAAALVIRVLDLLVQAGRFVLAAKILGMPLQIDTAVIAACTFYLVGVFSPSGSLGAREGATTGLAGLLAIPGIDSAAFSPITLTVSASEVLVYFAGTLLALGWLRPWGILRGKIPGTNSGTIAAGIASGAAAHPDRRVDPPTGGK